MSVRREQHGLKNRRRQPRYHDDSNKWSHTLSLELIPLQHLHSLFLGGITEFSKIHSEEVDIQTNATCNVFLFLDQSTRADMVGHSTCSLCNQWYKCLGISCDHDHPHQCKMALAAYVTTTHLNAGEGLLLAQWVRRMIRLNDK